MPDFESLLNDLRNDSPITKKVAAGALGKLGDARAIGPLMEALSDQNSQVRDNAAFALGELGAKGALPMLIRLMESDPDHWVRKGAAKALGILLDKVAVPALIRALSDQSSIVRKSAARALGQIGDHSARAALEKHAGTEDNVIVKKFISEALARIK